MAILMTIKDASAYFGIDKNIMYDLAKRSDVPVVKVGTRKKINSVLFQDWLNRKTMNHEEIK